ncbi:MAG: hypothetical protein A2942_00235 [Candidatus Lloydbacteria bacterium RIFCSPLOWO2_01_FULL_50_20]|uniref:Methyltransferase domain-containing protein n=1 Tax=Candidatus Lloydbacteria bacterium RIFCSPLOWO2_01_FULL_50_20 TaxID=1798665 RepID=A0A1G2DG18_9BACT|nr:MAG: hypothetical protein A3C13_04580 [Candidatus Lloydbacteria bacterium RIFCSPHIGHO2_02_FULL_50_11]OGZ12526.1 MAG: hypothetical protein A2942_00235 [Candidatus Lloydbacteria bacterium RIFCSPLOWO2_01_FULL_50_20]
MKEDNEQTQEEVNKVWENEWQNGGGENSAKTLFGQRLFIEGYPVFKKYIPKDAELILDVGGGTGRYGVKMAQDLPNAKVMVTDILPESLVIARSLAQEVNAKNVEFCTEDVRALSFPDDFFDVVFCDVVIQHLPDVENAMREMRRVCKQGGVLIVSVNNLWNPHTIHKFLMGKRYRYGYEKSYTRKELRDLFFGHHLEIVAMDGFYPAYSIFRLKMYWKPAAVIGSVLNRLNRIIDPWTGRFLSRHFGFEIFCVARKPQQKD